MVNLKQDCLHSQLECGSSGTGSARETEATVARSFTTPCVV